jgi:hypothetical protein
MLRITYILFMSVVTVFGSWTSIVSGWKQAYLRSASRSRPRTDRWQRRQEGSGGGVGRHALTVCRVSSSFLGSLYDA